MINPETILRPLEAVLEDAIAMDSFVDLQHHLPADILEQEQDVRTLLNQHVIPVLVEQTESKTKSSKKKKSQSSVGVVVLSAFCRGIFVSEGMVFSIERKLIPDLIANYAKTRAQEIDAAEVAGVSGGGACSKPTKSTSSKTKSGRKGKKGSKSSGRDDSHEEEHTEDIVPLIEVVQSIIKEYQELAEVDPALKEALHEAGTGGPAPHLPWDRTTDTDQNDSEAAVPGGGSYNDGLVCRFCCEAFYSEDLISNCQKAIQVELKRLQSARVSKASVSRKDAATKVRNVESAFEEAFVAYCYQIQAHAKFLDYIAGCEGDNNILVEKLTAEFLQGSCADFTRNMTQYCIFKHELDLDMFHFVRDKVESNPDSGESFDSNDDNNLPLYCRGPSMDIRRPPQTFLRLNECHSSDTQTLKTKDPLPKLREVLPGSVGVALARQWVMCGGSCYQGGTKMDEDGKFTRPGDLEKLLVHLEENCL